MIISVNRSSLEIMSSKSQIYTTNRNFSGLTGRARCFPSSAGKPRELRLVHIMKWIFW